MPIENSHTYEAYVQDTWKPRPNLSLNLGLRYDLQTKVWNEDFTQDRYPRPLPYVDFASRGDDNNFAPRVGVAWDVRSDARSIVRAGYGVIYTNVQHNIVAGEGSAFQQFAISIRNPTYPDPYGGRDPMSFVSTAPPNITIGANNLVNAPAQTGNVGLSQELRGGAAFHLDGIYTRIDDLPTNVHINQPDPVTRQVPLPEWGRIQQTQPIGIFRYAAFLARFDKRAARSVYTVSYTLSKQDARMGTISNIWTTVRTSGPPTTTGATSSPRADRSSCPPTSRLAPSGRCGRRVRSTRWPASI
jgi:outer membrane receptor protein involved in Fe transport